MHIFIFLGGSGQHPPTPEPQPGVEEAGVGEPGVEEAGVGEPGVEEAGVGEPGVEEAGVGEPGVEEAKHGGTPVSIYLGHPIVHSD